jgi:hypothetical protein
LNLPEAAELDYRWPLALGYLLPASLVVVSGVVAASSYSPAAIAAGPIGAVGMFATPPLIHAAYGNWLGAATAVVGIFGSASVGLLVGVSLSYRLGHPEKHCDEDERQAGSICAIGTAIGSGGLGGAGVGYSIWAVIDTVLNAHIHEPSTAPWTGFSMLPSWSPLLARERGGRLTFRGASLGAVATF